MQKNVSFSKHREAEINMHSEFSLSQTKDENNQRLNKISFQIIKKMSRAPLCCCEGRGGGGWIRFAADRPTDGKHFRANHENAHYRYKIF